MPSVVPRLGSNRDYWLRFCGHCSLQIRQPLFQREHRGKQVTQLFEARHYLLRFEYQQVGIFFLESALGFLPRDRRRNRGMLTRPQRIHGNGCFVFVVLAPVDKNFAGSNLLFHLRYNHVWMFVFEQLRQRVRERLGRSVVGRSVERNIDLQPLRS